MKMIQRKFYLPEELYTNLQILAQVTDRTITQTLRDLLAEGLKKTRPGSHKAAQGLLELGKLAQREKWQGPKDLAADHDRYFVEAQQRRKKKK